MSVLVDQGIPGVLLLAALLIWTWRAVRVATRKGQVEPRPWGYAAALGGALTVAVVAGQFSPYLKAEVQYWCLGLLMTLAAHARMSRVVAPSSAGAPVADTEAVVLTPAMERQAASGRRFRRVDS
jgi:O-antigen ligase